MPGALGHWTASTPVHRLAVVECMHAGQILALRTPGLAKVLNRAQGLRYCKCQRVL